MSDGVAARPRLEACWKAGLDAVDAGRAVARSIERDGAALSIAGRPVAPLASVVVLAAGKAAASMAAAVESSIGDRLRGGLVVTREGHAAPLARLPLRESAHPVPDERGAAAAREMLALAGNCRPTDVLLVLLSGGASAILSCPLPGLTLADLAATTRCLLTSGADIAALNCVRKHLSAIAGGRLAAAASAERVEVLAVSDVPGDDPAVIGSGPCAADATRFADALDVLATFGVLDQVPARVREHLMRGVRGEVPESLAPGAPELSRVRTTLVARNADARHAAGREAQRQGWRTIALGEVLRGEARTVGARLAALTCSVASAPTLWIAGGETTVTVSGAGRGGRSQELALAAAIGLQDREEMAILAAGTDGNDGPTDAAGAFVDAGTIARGIAAGVSARRHLAANDSYGFFAAAGGLLRTGPTGTNVMDLAIGAVGVP